MVLALTARWLAGREIRGFIDWPGNIAASAIAEFNGITSP
jgi:hypothetical protein